MDSMKHALALIERGVIQVLPDGTIWKLRNLNSTPLLQPRRLETKSKRGYLAVRVSSDSKSFMLAAHRLVWTVLRGPIPAGMDINHIDGNKHNNDPANLEPVSRGDNHRHAYRTGIRSAPSNLRPRILEKVAPQAKQLRAQGLPYSEIAARLGVSQTTAYRATKL